MAAPYRIAIGVNIDATGAQTGSRESVQAVNQISAAADRARPSVDKLINSFLGLDRQGANSNGRAADIQAYAAELDRLRGKFNPLFAVTRQYLQSQTEIRDAHRIGAISADEMTAALSRNRQATLASIDAIKGRNSAIAAGSQFNQRFASTNAMFQFQDIAMTAAGGMSPMMIGLQQGSQLAGGFAGMSGKEAGKTLIGGLAGLLSPLSLVTVGLTAAAAAAIQYGGSMIGSSEDARKLDEALKNQADTLSLLKQQYGEVGEASRNMLPAGGFAYTDARARTEIATYQKSLRAQAGELSKSLLGGGFFRGGLFGSSSAGLDDLLGTKGSPYQPAIKELMQSVREGNGGLEAFEKNLAQIFDTMRQSSTEPAKLHDELERLTAAAYDAFAVKPAYEPFQKEISRLILGLKEGNGNLSDFNANVKQIGASNGMQKVADEIILASKSAVDLFTNLRAVQEIYQRIDRENTREGLRDSRALTGYVNRREADYRQSQGQFAADQELARARTNAERLAAIEAQVRSRARLDGDKDGGLQARVDRALTEERTRQEMERREAALQRARALDRTLESQREEISLIGQTSIAADVLKQQYSLIADIREEAARKGIAADEGEIAAIRAKSAELIKLREQQARAQFLEDAKFDREQIGRNAGDQRIASQLKSAGLPVDLNSYEAGILRANDALREQVKVWEDIRGIGRDAIDELVDSGANGFKDFADVLKNIAGDVQKELLTLAIKNPLKNALYGDQLPTMETAGGIGGFFSALSGGPNPASKGGVNSTASMSVTAGTVMVNGGVAGGLAGPASAGGVGGFFSKLFGGAANGNTPAAGAAGAGSALSFVGNYKAGTDARLTDILNLAAQRTSGFSVEAISGYRAGDPRFHGQGLATDIRLRDLITGKALGNYQDASSFRAYEQFAQTARSIQMAKYPELADKFRWGGYFGGGKGKYGALDTMHFDLAGKGMAGGSWANGLTSAQKALWPGIESQGTAATKALENLAGQGNVAAQGLGSLGNGFTQFSQNLTNFFPAAPSGGSGGGFFSKLFGGLFGGGLSSYGKSAFSTSAQFSSAWSGGGMGLYADGGSIVGPGGPRDDAVPIWASNGEFMVNAHAAARYRPWLEAINSNRSLRAFRDGGHVSTGPVYPTGVPASSNASSGGVSIVVNNNSAARVQTEESRDEHGNRQISFTIADQVGTALAKPGGGARKQMERVYGVRPRGTLR